MPGSFSGNGSVKWLVTAKNVERATCEFDRPEQESPRNVRQDGVDRTDPGQYFTVIIKLPRDRKDKTGKLRKHRAWFLQELAKQVALVRGGKKTALKIRLPIEDRAHNHPREPTNDQIRILWKSSRTVHSRA